MRIVVEQLKIFEAKVFDILHCRIQSHCRERPAFAGQLFARLVEMIQVKMEIAESVDEFAGSQPADLRHHQGQK